MSKKYYALLELEDMNLIEIFDLLSSMRKYYKLACIYPFFPVPSRYVEIEPSGEIDEDDEDGEDEAHDADNAGDAEKASATMARLFGEVPRKKMSTEEKTEETPKPAESSVAARLVHMCKRGSVRLLINAKLWEQLKQEAASVGTLTTAEYARGKLRVKQVARPEATQTC